MSKIEEKIDKAAGEYSDLHGDLEANSYDDFVAGAKWALSHQWVSVDDELPPYDTDILGMENESVYLCKRMGMCDGEDVYIINDAGEFSPTHWMPIPPLPETRKEGEV